MAALAFSGLGVEICGVEPDPAGVRVYVGPRYRGRYFLVTHPEGVEACKRAWAGSYTGHLLMDRREVPYLLTEYRESRSVRRVAHTVV